MENNDIEAIIVRALAGQASPAEEHALQRWLEEAASHRRQYEQAQQLWGAAADVDFRTDPKSEEEWRQLSERLEPAATGAEAPLRRLPLWRYAAAAVLALGLIGFAVLYWGQGLGGPAIALQYEAGYGQQERVVLPDGSQVHLNAGSILSVLEGFGEQERRVLLAGEAFFEASSDPSRPFVIEAGEAVVRITGTAFNLRAYPTSATVKLSVTEGAVAFSAVKGAQQTVAAGQAATLDKASGEISKLPFDARAAAWQEGILVFDNTPFPEALRTLERQYNIKIEGPAALERERYTAVFDNRSLEEVLAVMQATFGFEIDRQAGRIILF